MHGKMLHAEIAVNCSPLATDGKIINDRDIHTEDFQNMNRQGFVSTGASVLAEFNISPKIL